jgi:hypothetical protein
MKSSNKDQIYFYSYVVASKRGVFRHFFTIFGYILDYYIELRIFLGPKIIRKC